VPTADSLVSTPATDHSKSGRGAPATVWNVLAEDYWDLYTLLMR
jgi:hypothetical protein